MFSIMANAMNLISMGCITKFKRLVSFMAISLRTHYDLRFDKNTEHCPNGAGNIVRAQYGALSTVS